MRTKDGAEVDFCLNEQQVLTHLFECKLPDHQPHRALVRFAAQFPQAQAAQLVRDLRPPEARRGVGGGAGGRVAGTPGGMSACCYAETRSNEKLLSSARAVACSSVMART